MVKVFADNSGGTNFTTLLMMSFRKVGLKVIGLECFSPRMMMDDCIKNWGGCSSLQPMKAVGQECDLAGGVGLVMDQ